MASRIIHYVIADLVSIRMYEKFGFMKVGVYKDYFNVNGEYDDE